MSEQGDAIADCIKAIEMDAEELDPSDPIGVRSLAANIGWWCKRLREYVEATP